MAQDDGSMWDVMDDIEKAEGGGGAIFGLIRFAVGYKTYATSVAQTDDFFPFDPFNAEKTKPAALEAAKKFADEHGVGKRPQVIALLQVYKDKVVGREVTWKGDRFFSTPIWTPAYKEIVKPNLQKAGVKKPGDYWGRIGFQQDPDPTRMEAGQDGELRRVLVEFLAQVYPNREACVAAAGGEGGQSTGTSSASASGPAPKGWDSATWEAIKPELTTAIEAKLAGKPKTPAVINAALKGLATDYGVTIDDLKPLVPA